MPLARHPQSSSRHSTEVSSAQVRVNQPCGQTTRQSSQQFEEHPRRRQATRRSPYCPAVYPTDLQVTTTHDKQANPSVSLSSTTTLIQAHQSEFFRIWHRLPYRNHHQKTFTRLGPPWSSHETLLTLTTTHCHQQLSPIPPRLRLLIWLACLEPIRPTPSWRASRSARPTSARPSPGSLPWAPPSSMR